MKVEHRGRTLTIIKGPPRNHRGHKKGEWVGHYDGDTSTYRADTSKALIERFKDHVDCDQLPLPEVDALFARWGAAIREISPRVGLHTAATEIMTLQKQMGMAQILMRSQALEVEKRIAALRAKCTADMEPGQIN